MGSIKESILVTGTNGGLGSAIVKRIASSPELSGYHGLYTVRDAQRAPVLSTILADAPSHSHELCSVDLTDLDSVRHLAKNINAKVAAGTLPPIRALILNAGLQDFGKQSLTEDGLDKVFSANYLGHWLLTLLLLQSMDKDSGRVIILGSESHDPLDSRNSDSKAFVEERHKTVLTDEATVGEIARGTWNAPNQSTEPAFRPAFRRYGAAKLFLVMMVHELQRRLDRADPSSSSPASNSLCVVGVDPGRMGTGLARQAPWFIRVLVMRVLFPLLALLRPGGNVRRPATSAAHVLEAALGVGAERPKGRYFNGLEPWETSVEAQDAVKRDWVWKESVRCARLEEGETVLVDWR
ncbi:uncharacterized protein PG998_000128 [Apiospora kogelbergensis]|uniref:uncharacterized protein n=1 Tax=Apiospora kogelbergensis TaxID=1337665 RepID=UPI0031303A94